MLAPTNGTPLGHDIHFLERLQEVDTPHVDTAMALYKDPALLRAVLGHLELPDEAERVALSLADPVLGPFLIVQRNGHFVTCLREGMVATDLLIVPRGRLDAIVGKVESLRERWAAAMALTGGENVSRTLMRRLASAGQGLSREEFLAISAVQPLMLDHFFEVLGKALELLQSVRSLARKPARARHLSAELLDRYWNMRCLVGHLTVLFAMDCQSFLKNAQLEPATLLRRMVFGPMAQGLLGMSVLGAWAAGRFGKYVLPALRQFHTNPLIPGMVLYSGMALLGIAGRSTQYRGEIGKLLERNLEVGEADRDMVEMSLSLCRIVFSKLILDGDPDSLFAELGGAEYLQQVAHLPPDSPLRYATAREVPEALILPAVATSEGRIDTNSRLHTMVVAAARIARAEPAELYYPESVVRNLVAPLSEAAARSVLVDDAARSYVSQPVRAASRPGRNDPCPCGSEKKYKRCCG
jgi:hypothetical protein